MRLTRLVYYSERNPSASVDLRSLIRTCHKNNSRANLTGMLHFDGTAFLQVLEGGRADVSAIYHRIAADPRHINIILIGCQDARERLFPTWSMGLHEGRSDTTKSMFLRYFAGDRIDPESVPVEGVLDVLQDIAAEMR